MPLGRNMEILPEHILPEDFRKNSDWAKLIEKYGAEPYVDLFKKGGKKIYVPHWIDIKAKAEKRIYRNKPY
jgi:hypothetical protein